MLQQGCRSSTERPLTPQISPRSDQVSTVMFELSEHEDTDCFAAEKIGEHLLWLQIAEDDFNAEKKTLFATMIWHGARALSNYLASDVSDFIKGKSIIEFGAAAGLPSLTCYKIGASTITSTDYPASAIIFNLRRNAVRNVFSSSSHYNGSSYSSSSSSNSAADHKSAKNDELLLNEKNFYVKEHIWGSDVTSLLEPTAGNLYDIVIAAECLWKSDTHEDFASSICAVLKRGGTAYLSFSHHIPGLEKNDLNFFDLLCKKHFSVVSIKEVCVPHMWSDKAATVYIYEVIKDF